LLVVEGYVAEVEIDQKIPYSAVIEDARLRILNMHPLNTIALERLLLVLNDMPDLNVSAVLASIKTTEPTNVPQGAVRLLLQKNDKPYSYGKVAFDNYGSVFSGPYQVRGLAQAPHVFVPYGQMSLMLLGATQLPEQRYGALSYEMPVFGASGTTLSLSGTIARTEPGSNLDPLDVQGRSESIAGNISYPLIKQRAEELNIDAGFEFKDSKTDLLGERLYDDRQRILSAGMNYNFSDSLFGLNIFDIHFSKGLNILGVREKGSVDLSRADGHPDFSKFNMAAGRLQALPENFEAYVMLTGQYSNTPLLSSEEFGFGGDQIGRGYNPSEIAGDRGMSASLEIRYKSMVEYEGWNVAIQPYGFFDIGKVWNIDNDDTTHMSGASTGIGSRFNVNNQWDSDVSLAFPLTRHAENPPKYSGKYGPRLMFSLSRKF
jgi:hemolysin activation/secretion protein